jgi:hypothetical protein
VKLKEKQKCLQWNSLIPGIDYLVVATDVTKTLKKEVEPKNILFS